MRAPATTAALVILAGAGVAACSLAGLTFDLAGAGGSATTTSSTASGGASGTTVTVTGAATSSSTGVVGVCGDGTVDPGESCDDGNLLALDGCSPACTTDVPGACPGALAPLTPAGLTIQGTLVGETQDLEPSCGLGKADVVYAVVPSVSGTLAASIVSNGGQAKSTTLSIRSSCADGFASELACKQATSPTVQIWAQAGVTSWVVVSGDNAPFTLDLKLFPCGDGQVQGLEQCDDPADAKCLGCVKCTGNGEFRDPLSKHCYLFSALAFGQKPWSSARASCVAWGGDLAGLGSQAEIDFVTGKVPIAMWIGGTDAANECAYSWTNGEPWHAKWEQGQPDDQNGIEDCVALTQNGAMNDLACANSMGFLCERTPAGACGDGIVQPGEECDDAIAAANFDCTGCKLACKAGEFEDPATRHCYRVVPDLVSANSAVNACAALGATLASINTAAENALIQAHLTAPSWIGLVSGSKSTWSNGDPVCFIAAGNPQLGSGCALIFGDGTWSTAGCSATRGYVCEREN